MSDSGLSSVVQFLGGLISSLPLSKVQRERLEFAKDQCEYMARRYEDLNSDHTRQANAHADLHVKHQKLVAQHAALEREHLALQAELLALKSQPAEEFIEHEGSLFKRLAAGSYSKSVYCPNCRKVAGGGFDVFPFTCSCGWSSSFVGGPQFNSIFAALNRRQ